MSACGDLSQSRSLLTKDLASLAAPQFFRPNTCD